MIKILALCGMLSLSLFVLMVIVGGALRPGYSHISDTVSELFSPGAPNKMLLDIFHTTSAVLTVLFGIGVLMFVRESGHSEWMGVTGAIMIIAIGTVNVATATVFPQDAWGAPSTFPGEMHKILAMGVLPVLFILSTLLMGIWLNRASIFPGFGTYSFISVGIVLLSGVLTMMTMGTPIMGLAERIVILACNQWTFVFALRIFKG